MPDITQKKLIDDLNALINNNHQVVIHLYNIYMNNKDKANLEKRIYNNSLTQNIKKLLILSDTLQQMVSKLNIESKNEKKSTHQPR